MLDMSRSTAYGRSMQRRPPELLTAEEVADILGVHPNTVRGWVREGRVAAVRLPGGMMRFRREDLDALMTPTKKEPSE